MSATNTRVRLVFLIIVIIALLAFVIVQARNFLVQRIYQGQVKNIKLELHDYKELNDINYEMWGGDNNLKQTVSLKNRVKKLSPSSNELKESKKHLLKALEYIYLAQKESGLSLSQLNLEENQAKLAQPKEYLEKADSEAARSSTYLNKFEETHRELFQ